MMSLNPIILFLYLTIFAFEFAKIVIFYDLPKYLRQLLTTKLMPRAKMPDQGTVERQNKQQRIQQTLPILHNSRCESFVESRKE